MLQTLFPSDAQLGELGAESYIGVPLVSASGRLLGHLAILDDRPMAEGLSRTTILSGVARRAAAELRETSARTLTGLIPICAWCKKVRDETGDWQEPEEYVRRRTKADFTHGICPGCVREVYAGRVKMS